MNTQFNTFAQMMTALPDDKACREYLELKRWGGVPTCPHCGTIDDKHYRLNVKGEFKGMYKCRACKERFTVTLGTMFEGSPISLRKWFIAAYIFASHKKGISSHQLSRDLGVTQKTAWFMLHRLREAFSDKDGEKMGGEGVIVETDSSIAGGKTKNMSNAKRRAFKEKKAAAFDNKTIITAYVERAGSIRFDVKDNGENEPDLVRKHVDTGSVLMTDTALIYNTVGKEFADHQAVDHGNHEYVRGHAHTNTVEGAFGLFDRMILGIYHSCSRKHMQAYCNESAFRYNSRKISDKVRFDLALTKTNGVRLQYATLISK